MSEENNNNTPPEGKPAEGAPPKDGDFPAMKKAEEFLQKLTEKEKSLEEKEKALDEKMQAFDKKAAEIRLAGFGIHHQEKSEDEKSIEAANKLMDGTGFDFSQEPFDAFEPKKRK